MPPPPEIIDLVSDSEDEAPPPVAAARLRQLPAHQRGHFAAIEPENDIFADYFPDPGPRNDPGLPAMGDLVGVPLVIDDFDYLEEDPPLDEEATTDPPEEGDAEQPPVPDTEPALSQEDCLSRVLDLFPDICPEHATKICSRAGQNSLLSAAALLDQVVEKLLADSTYPKRKKETLKRKREESVDRGFERWERGDREALPHNIAGDIKAILKVDFPTFALTFIAKVFTEEKFLFKSYIRLANLRDTEIIPRRGRASADNANADAIARRWPELDQELAAARRKAQANKNKRSLETKMQMEEEENLQHAIATGQTAECQACFDDLPINRQIHCHGEVPHYTCNSCIKIYIASEIGDARCNVMCTAGCGAGFEPAQLNRIDDKRLLEKLADLQQEQDIRNAGLENLEECPFCDYKAIMPPIEEDFEFRCANPECEKVSCRRCKAPTHIPISCEQHAKDKKACSRHTIEEAMTAALLRSCNSCKKQFIKEYGCNKMTCPSCKNLQCYVCSETLKGYDHFDQHPGGGARVGGKCPLYDNLEERHEREVQAARETATALVIANNPDVVPEDLEIKLSDAVKKATARQIRQAGPEGLGGGPAVGAAHWGGAAALRRGLGGRAPRFIDEDDDEDFEDFDDEDADPFGPHMGLHLQAQAMFRQRIAQARAEALPALAQGNMVPAGPQARLRRQQGQRRQEEEEIRDMGNAVQAGGAAPAPRPLDAVQRLQQMEDVHQRRVRDRQLEDARQQDVRNARQQHINHVQQLEDAREQGMRDDQRLRVQQLHQLEEAREQNRQRLHQLQQVAARRALRVPPPPRQDPQQHDNNPVDERRDHGQRWRPVPDQQPPPLAPSGLDALFHDFEQLPQALQYPQPPRPQPMAQPPAQAFDFYDRLDAFNADRGFEVARVGARHYRQPVGVIGDARGDVPRPNAQLNAAGLANVQRNLHDLELMRQRHDERMGNFPAVPLPPPRMRGPQYFGWE